MITKQWWGIGECVDGFLDYLTENIEFFKHYVFYAHNAGKFDDNFLLQRVMVRDSITVQGNCELGGRWLNITLKIDRQHKIHFRDSWTFLQCSLDDACRDFKVKHQKLIETINHDQINCFNYNKLNPKKNQKVTNKCLELYEQFKNQDIDVLWDDRDKRPGVKFNDMEVTGIPLIIIVGERTLKTGEIELKERLDEKPKLVSHQDLISIIKS